jgi:hydrogenase/urease accessory protein HupE
LEISKQRLELKVTYDLFTLHKITPLDDNRDHRITREELEKHLPEIQKFLAASVELEVQGLDAGLGKPIGFTWPKDAEEGVAEKDFHSPAFLIPFRFERAIDDLPEEVTLTFRLFSKLGDRHSILGKFVYDGKESEVTFNQFEPDFSFETGYEPPLYRRIQKFFKLGMEHIFFGFDHLCFLLALFVVATPRDLLKIITSFTLAHTITLLLAALNVVRLPSRLVESSIALTIVYVAAENLWPKPRPHRWALTFAFGLIHGFGFASVLESLALPSSGLIRCLLSFNVGVEVGQLVIVAAFLPLVLLLRNARYGILTARIISCGLATIGTAWFLDRVLSLGWMPI